MATVYLLIAEHHTVAGRILEAHATADSANARAADLVRIMAGDSPAARHLDPVTRDNWQAVLERLQDYHGAAHCFVEIEASEIVGTAPDFVSANLGSFMTLTPMTPAAGLWVADNLPSADHDGTVYMEPRYFADIARGALAAGLTIQDAGTGRMASDPEAPAA